MQVVTERHNLWTNLQPWRAQGESIGLVPTMGNLHHGHLRLVSQIREQTDRVVVSIYVNPTQFAPGEDFKDYPRTLPRDLEKLEHVGADLVFVPTDRVLYPVGLDSAIRVPAPADLANQLCGISRRGHFDGVTTVVSRLFNLIQPNVAIFGEKDYQQLLIIERLVTDMGYPIDILGCPTVREDDGLALSSRNQYLNPQQRRQASAIYSALHEAATLLRQDPQNLAMLEQQGMARLESAGLQPEYFAIRDAASLQAPNDSRGQRIRILAAAQMGRTRLIDNIGLTPDSHDTSE